MNDMQTIYKAMNDHLLTDIRPSEYFDGLIRTEFFQKEYPFILLSRLREIDQSPKHHPEGNVWNHTLLVLDNAAQVRERSKDPKVFMWAALLHDIGKATTTRIRRGRITSYDHDKEGEKLSREFLECFAAEKEFIEKVSRMVRWHMQILFVTNNLPFSNINEMKRQADIEEIALLGFCDRLGRKMEQDVQKEIETMENFIKACKGREHTENSNDRRDHGSPHSFIR